MTLQQMSGHFPHPLSIACGTRRKSAAAGRGMTRRSWEFRPFTGHFPNSAKKVRENGAEILYFPTAKRSQRAPPSLSQITVINLTSAPAIIDCTAAIILDKSHNPPHNIVVLSSIFQRRRRCADRLLIIIATHIPLQGMSAPDFVAGDLGIWAYRRLFSQIPGVI